MVALIANERVACLRGEEIFGVGESTEFHLLHDFMQRLVFSGADPFDGIYPVLTPEGQIDYDHPLQLLAKSIEWLDPIAHTQRRFESLRSLDF